MVVCTYRQLEEMTQGCTDALCPMDWGLPCLLKLILVSSVSLISTLQYILSYSFDSLVPNQMWAIPYAVNSSLPQAIAILCLQIKETVYCNSTFYHNHSHTLNSTTCNILCIFSHSHIVLEIF